MRKYREQGKLERQNNNSLAIQQSQGLLVSSSSKTMDNILSHVLGAVLQMLKPHWVEDVNFLLPTSTETPDQLEPEG